MGVGTVSNTRDAFDAVISSIVSTASQDPDQGRAIDALTFADNYRAYDLIEDELMALANAYRIDAAGETPGSANQELALALRQCMTVIRSIARNKKRDMRAAVSQTFGVPTDFSDVLHYKANDVVDDAAELRARARNAIRARVSTAPLIAGILGKLALKATTYGSKIKSKLKQSRRLTSVVRTVRQVASSAKARVKPVTDRIKRAARPITRRLPEPVRRALKKPAVLAGVGGAVGAIALAGGAGLVSRLKDKNSDRSSKSKGQTATNAARRSVSQNTSEVKESAGTLDKLKKGLGKGILAVTDFIGLPRAEEWQQNKAQAAGKTARAIGMWMAPGGWLTQSMWIGGSIGEDIGGGFREDAYKYQYQNGIVNGTVSRPNCTPSSSSSFFGGLSGMYVSCTEKQKLYDQASTELEAPV